MMDLKDEMKAMVRHTVREVAPRLHVQNVFEPLHPAGIWGISLFDADAERGKHILQIGIGPVDERGLETVRDELASKLAAFRLPRGD